MRRRLLRTLASDSCLSRTCFRLQREPSARIVESAEVVLHAANTFESRVIDRAGRTDRGTDPSPLSRDGVDAFWLEHSNRLERRAHRGWLGFLSDADRTTRQFRNAFLPCAAFGTAAGQDERYVSLDARGVQLDDIECSN